MELNMCRMLSQTLLYIGRQVHNIRRFLQLITYGRRIQFPDLFSRIEAVDTATIKRVANRFIFDQDIAIAASGPVKLLPDYNCFRRRTFQLRYYGLCFIWLMLLFMMLWLRSYAITNQINNLEEQRSSTEDRSPILNKLELNEKKTASQYTNLLQELIYYVTFPLFLRKSASDIDIWPFLSSCEDCMIKTCSYDELPFIT